MLLTTRRSAMALSVFLLLDIGGVAQGEKAGHAPVEPAAPLPPLLAEWMTAEKAGGNIHVTFQQSRSMPTLKAPVSSSGEFWRMSDGRFRWQLGQPATLILIHDGKTVRMLEEGTQEWKLLDPKDRRVSMWLSFLGGQDMSAEKMAKGFNAKVASATPERVAFVLQPKSVLVRKHLRQIELHINHKTKHLLQLRLVQGDDSSVTMDFDRPSSATDTPDLFK